MKWIYFLFRSSDVALNAALRKIMVEAQNSSGKESIQTNHNVMNVVNMTISVTLVRIIYLEPESLQRKREKEGNIKSTQMRVEVERKTKLLQNRKQILLARLYAKRYNIFK